MPPTKHSTHYHSRHSLINYRLVSCWKSSCQLYSPVVMLYTLRVRYKWMGWWWWQTLDEMYLCAEQNVYDGCILRSKTSCGFRIYLRLSNAKWNYACRSVLAARRANPNCRCGTAVLIYVFMSVHVILVPTDSLMCMYLKDNKPKSLVFEYEE